MSKYILTETQDEIHNDASNKPRQDINQLLKQRGYQFILLPKFKNKFSRLMNSRGAIRRMLAGLSEEDILLVHYPMYMGRFFDGLLLREAQRKGIKTIGFIHDVNALRLKASQGRDLRYEIAILNKYSYLVSPNDVMLKLLRKQGMRTKSVNLELFDYLVNAENKEAVYSHTVYFTGNLNKSEFILKLKNSGKVSYRFYGPLKDPNVLGTNMYFGSLPSDILLKKINSGFGLVWDGTGEMNDDLDRISSGNYLRYNNPYKLSFYIAAGIPVIIWEKAAEAGFVVKHGLGFTISSLTEVPEIVSSTSNSEYLDLASNVEVVRNKIVNGAFTNSAISKIENAIEKS